MGVVVGCVPQASDDTLFVGGSGIICAFNLTTGQQLPSIGAQQLVGRQVSSLSVDDGLLLAADDGLDGETLLADGTEFIAAIDLTTDEQTIVLTDRFAELNGLHPSGIAFRRSSVGSTENRRKLMQTQINIQSNSTGTADETDGQTVGSSGQFDGTPNSVLNHELLRLLRT
jgi:hypothetical protein